MTQIRSAWNVRVAGSMRWYPRRGIARRTICASVVVVLIGSSDPARIPFFAVLEDHVGERLLVGGRNQVGCGRSLRAVHPHVQRIVAPEAEAAAFSFELHRGHTQIRQRSVDAGNATLVEHARQVAIIRVHQLHAVTEPGERFRRNPQRLRVAIESEDARRSGLEQRSRVAAQAHGAIDEQPASRWREECHRFGDHHRFVQGCGHERQIPKSASARASASV